jgi:hypothetical protein
VRTLKDQKAAEKEAKEKMMNEEKEEKTEKLNFKEEKPEEKLRYKEDKEDKEDEERKVEDLDLPDSVNLNPDLFDSGSDWWIDKHEELKVTATPSTSEEEEDFGQSIDPLDLVPQNLFFFDTHEKLVGEYADLERFDSGNGRHLVFFVVMVCGERRKEEEGKEEGGRGPEGEGKEEEQREKGRRDQGGHTEESEDFSHEEEEEEDFFFLLIIPSLIREYPTGESERFGFLNLIPPKILTRVCPSLCYPLVTGNRPQRGCVGVVFLFFSIFSSRVLVFFFVFLLPRRTCSHRIQLHKLINIPEVAFARRTPRISEYSSAYYSWTRWDAYWVSALSSAAYTDWTWVVWRDESKVDNSKSKSTYVGRGGGRRREEKKEEGRRREEGEGGEGKKRDKKGGEGRRREEKGGEGRRREEKGGGRKRTHQF